jgi:hypothetical protein
MASLDMYATKRGPMPADGGSRLQRRARRLTLGQALESRYAGLTQRRSSARSSSDRSRSAAPPASGGPTGKTSCLITKIVWSVEWDDSEG